MFFVNMVAGAFFCDHITLTVVKLVKQTESHQVVFGARKEKEEISIENLLDNSVLSTVKSLPGMKCDSKIIIPGSNPYSDMTIPISIFKNRLKDTLLKTQKLGSFNEWQNDINFISP